MEKFRTDYQFSGVKGGFLIPKDSDMRTSPSNGSKTEIKVFARAFAWFYKLIGRDVVKLEGLDRAGHVKTWFVEGRSLHRWVGLHQDQIGVNDHELKRMVREVKKQVQYRADFENELALLQARLGVHVDQSAMEHLDREIPEIRIHGISSKSTEDEVNQICAQIRNIAEWGNTIESTDKAIELFLKLRSKKIPSSYDQLAKQLLDLNLNAWGESPLVSGDKKDAIKAIRNAFEKNQPSLDLSNLSLNSLPSSIGLCKYLQTLKCEGNDLEAVPESLSYLNDPAVSFKNNPKLESTPINLFSKCSKAVLDGTKITEDTVNSSHNQKIAEELETISGLISQADSDKDFQGLKQLLNCLDGRGIPATIFEEEIRTLSNALDSRAKIKEVIVKPGILRQGADNASRELKESSENKEALLTFIEEASSSPEIDPDNVQKFTRLKNKKMDLTLEEGEKVRVFERRILRQEIGKELERWEEDVNAKGCKNLASTRILEAFDRESEVLNLAGLDLNELPKNMKGFSFLKRLDLSWNQFSFIPQNFVSKFENLEDLQLHHNNVRSVLGMDLEGLSHVKTLNLSFNKIGSFLHVGKLLKLEKLYLDYNPDFKMEGWGPLPPHLIEIGIQETKVPKTLDLSPHGVTPNRGAPLVPGALASSDYKAPSSFTLIVSVLEKRCNGVPMQWLTLGTNGAQNKYRRVLSYKPAETEVGSTRLFFNTEEIPPASAQTEFSVDIDQNGRFQKFYYKDESGKEYVQDTIPTQFHQDLDDCFHHAFFVSRSYSAVGNGVSVKVIREDVKRDPESHLVDLKFSISEKCKEGVKDPKLFVKFLNDDLTESEGIDAGGLSRDYIDDLVGALVKQKKYFHQLEGSSLVMPKCGKDFFKKRWLFFRQLGEFMMYCFRSTNTSGRHFNDSYATGCYFDEALFHGALAFSADDLKKSFQDLKIETKLEVCKALTKAEDNKLYTERIELYEKLQNKPNLTISDPDVADSLDIIEGVGLMPGEYWDDDGALKRDLVLSEGKLLEALAASIFDAVGGHGKYGEQLEVVHAVAQGMRSFLKFQNTEAEADFAWETEVRVLPIDQFSRKIQGSIDRQTIVANMVTNNPLGGTAGFNQKVTWLKAWILSDPAEGGATDEEVAQFLKFVTGAASLPEGKNITLAEKDDQVIQPTAHTCTLQLDIPGYSNPECQTDEDKKTEFLEVLKAVIQVSGFDSS